MPTVLPSTQAVWLVLVGILLSVLLPLAVSAFKKAAGLEGADGKADHSFSARLKAAWIRYGGNKYLIMLLAGTLIAFVIVFLLGMTFSTGRDAILAGFAWESLLSKLKKGS
jgi:hypothetical protein